MLESITSWIFIGRTIPEFKFFPLDGNSIRVSEAFVFSNPSGATIMGAKRVRNVDKTKF